MIKNSNKKRKIPVILGVSIAVSIGALALLNRYGYLKPKKEDYIPMSSFREISEDETDHLPLSYDFADIPVSVSLPMGEYADIPGGIGGGCGEGFYLFVFTEKEDADSLETVLDNCMGLAADGYARNSSYAKELQKEEGVIGEKSISGESAYFYASSKSGLKPYFSFIYDSSWESYRICICTVTSLRSDNAKDRCVYVTEQVYASMKENLDFEYPKEAEEEEDPDISLYIEDIKVTDLENPEKEPEMKHQKEKEDPDDEEPESEDKPKEKTESTKKDQGKESQGTPKGSESQPDKEESTEGGQSEPALDNNTNDSAQSDSTSGYEEKSDSENVTSDNVTSENVTYPSYDGNSDVSVQNFDSPISGANMVVNVYVSNYVAEAVCTLSGPDGYCQSSSFSGSGSCSFTLTSTEGMYTLSCTYFSRVGQVSADISFGG